MPCDRTTSTTFLPLASGQCDAVLMWWEVKMDQVGDIVLSCAPYWAHPDLARESCQSFVCECGKCEFVFGNICVWEHYYVH